MPVITIKYPSTLKIGFTKIQEQCFRAIESGLMNIEALELSNVSLISIKCIETEGNDNSFIAEVILDKKPGRDKMVLDGIAGVVRDAIKKIESVVKRNAETKPILIEVFVSPFDRSVNGFSVYAQKIKKS